MEASREEIIEELTARANRARSKLLGTLGRLDQRRHVVVSAETEVMHHIPLVVGGAAFVGGGAVAMVAYRHATANARRRRERLLLLQRLWLHPEWGARDPGSLVGNVAKSLLLGALGTIAKALLMKALRGASEPPPRVPTNEPPPA